jgi:hypothetical protein
MAAVDGLGEARPQEFDEFFQPRARPVTGAPTRSWGTPWSRLPGPGVPRPARQAQPRYFLAPGMRLGPGSPVISRALKSKLKRALKYRVLHAQKPAGWRPGSGL